MFNSIEDTLSIIAIILIFGGSIFIHELGHFLVAKARGLKATRFSIGFGPKIFAWRGKDGCQYRISLLPLGGYVALPQLADMEELEGSDLSKEEISKLKKASFTDKVLVSAAGAFFNVLLAIVMAFLVYLIGIPTAQEGKTNIIGFIPENSQSTQVDSELSLKEGDAILAIDSTKIESFNDVRMMVALGSNRDETGKAIAVFTILRDGKELEVKTYPSLEKTNIKTGDEVRMLDIYPASQMIIGKIMENSPAEKAGFKAGDEVLKIDGKRIYANARFSSELNKVEGKCTITLLREGEEIDLVLEPKKIARTKALCEIFTPSDSKNALISIICTNPKTTDITENEVGILKLIAKGDEGLVKELKLGSSLYEVGNKEISSLAQLNTIINAKAEDESLILKFINSTALTDINLEKGAYSKIIPPQETAMAGYYLASNTKIEHPSVITQIKESFNVTYQAMKTLFNFNSDIGINHMSGPVGISRVIYKISKVDIALLLSFTVLLNINLAILNMLPLPILDGGHIVMAIIEKLTGKAIQKSLVVKIIQSIFALGFIALMIYIIYMDTQRWRGDINQEDISTIQNQYYLKDLDFKNNE